MVQLVGQLFEAWSAEDGIVRLLSVLPLGQPCAAFGAEDLLGGCGRLDCRIHVPLSP